jgi:hypothetical protein
MAKKSIAPKSVIITKSYSEYTEGKILFNDIDHLPSVEAIMATPYSDDFKQHLLKRREVILNRTMTA